MDEMTLAVVGIDFPNEDRARSNRRFELLASAVGDPVSLRPEPRNPHDPRAIAVFSARDVQVGYISAERAPLVGARLRRGEPVQAVFQGIRGSVAYIGWRNLWLSGTRMISIPILTAPTGEPDARLFMGQQKREPKSGSLSVRLSGDGPGKVAPARDDQLLSESSSLTTATTPMATTPAAIRAARMPPPASLLPLAVGAEARTDFETDRLAVGLVGAAATGAATRAVAATADRNFIILILPWRTTANTRWCSSSR
jgi:hypothetical protein